MLRTEQMDGLTRLGARLDRLDYRFTTITPASHQVVYERHCERVGDGDVLRRLFGWSMAVRADEVPRDVLDLMRAADVAVAEGELLRSRVRFSTLDDRLFVHSAYPTNDVDAIFFGPDTYRFVRFARQAVTEARMIVDLGCGSGAGGIALALALTSGGREAPAVYGTDVNEAAVVATRINARINGLERLTAVTCDLLRNVPPGADVVIANPPFVMDPAKRSYRDGGATYGASLSVRIVDEALRYLPPGGKLVVYTGSCVVRGRDVFRDAVEPLLDSARHRCRYEEIDPDIFGEELRNDAYREVERIAAVGLVVDVMA